MFATHFFRVDAASPVGKAGFFAVVATLLVFGCATVPQSMTDDVQRWEKRVSDRAEQRWVDAIAGRTQAAFALYSKSSRVDYPESMVKRHVDSLRATGAKVVSAKCSEKSCNVTLEISVQVAVPRISARAFPIPAQERWVLEDGDVYFVRQ
jgi:hypothetical protein